MSGIETLQDIFIENSDYAKTLQKHKKQLKEAKKILSEIKEKYNFDKPDAYEVLIGNDHPINDDIKRIIDIVSETKASKTRRLNELEAAKTLINKVQIAYNAVISKSIQVDKDQKKIDNFLDGV